MQTIYQKASKVLENTTAVAHSTNLDNAWPMAGYVQTAGNSNTSSSYAEVLQEM